MARNKVIEPLGDYKSDYEFWIELGVRIGYGKAFWNGSIDNCMNKQLEPLNLTLEELRTKPTGIMFSPKPAEYEKYSRVFGTPSTRFWKAPYLPQGKVAGSSDCRDFHRSTAEPKATICIVSILRKRLIP
jgi:anaerobic selenocysteine-containing dehydrogenase